MRDEQGELPLAYTEIGLQEKWPILISCRENWEAWLKTASESGHKHYWDDTEGCEGCKHLDGLWCCSMELPATYNPYLTPRYGMVGMACMGAGKEPEAVEA